MNERLPLDAVVFDAGGTLVRLDYEWIAGMLEDLGVLVAPADVRRGEVRGRLAYDASMRAGTDGAVAALPRIEVYWGAMLAAAGCPHGHLEEAIRRLREREQSDAFLWSKPMEGARKTIDRLRAMGLKLACISNSDGRAEQHLIRFGLRDGLEFVLDSAIVGIEKPDPRIFDAALERLEVIPSRALYVGDIRSVDEHGSRSAGMHFVLLDPWSTYANREVASVAGLEPLPDHVEQHFLTPAERQRAGS